MPAWSSYYYAPDQNFIIATRFILGAGGSFSLLLVLKVAHKAFERKYFPIINGITVVVGTLGFILANQPIRHFLQQALYKEFLFFNMLRCAGLLFLAMFGIKPPDNSKNTGAYQIEKTQDGVSYFSIFSSKQILFACLYTGLTYSLVIDFAFFLWLWCWFKIIGGDYFKVWLFSLFDEAMRWL